MTATTQTLRAKSARLTKRNKPAASSIFEPLEARQLMSVTNIGGVMTINTGSANDNVNVDYVYNFDTGNTDVFVSGAGTGDGTYPDNFNQLNINTGDGNDTVFVSFCGETTAVRADLGAGNDHLTLSDGNQNPATVFGGAGNDVIATIDGNDYVDAGLGDDSVNTGDGDDTIVSGGGLDSITGGSGEDQGANYNDIQLKADGSRIEAENFDEGGPGVAYYDQTDANYGGVYRDTPVDLDNTPSGGVAVISTETGEYLNYGVRVANAGTYRLTVNASSATSDGSINFRFVDGLGNTVATVASKHLQNTGSYNNYTSQDFGLVNLPRGRLTMQMSVDGENWTDYTAGNIDYYRLTPVTTGAITGNVFNDANQNWVKDSGETGVYGTEVYLDTNNNGRVDSGEPVTLTNTSGNYTFSNVSIGTKHVRIVTPSGYRAVVGTPTNRDVSVTAGHTTTGVNFDLTTRPLITGKVFNDTNGNGHQDTGEAGVAGLTVYVDLNNNGRFDAGENSRTTDANGNFAFAGLNAGSYVIRVVKPTGYTQTTPGSNTGLHVTAANGQTINAGLFGVKHI